MYRSHTEDEEAKGLMYHCIWEDGDEGVNMQMCRIR